MTSIESLVAQLSGPNRQDIEEWVSNDWVRPDGPPGFYAFRQIDVARVRLIYQLRVDMQVNDAALPIVLSLLDQLYDHRRRMRDLSTALSRIAPRDIRQMLSTYLSNM